MSITEKTISDNYLRCSKFPTDPDTRLEVFKKHWICTVKTMSKDYLTLDESEPVIYYMEQMVSLMIEEQSNDIPGMSGPIFKYSLDQDVFNKIYELSSKFMGEPLERLKHQQLRLFSVIVSQAHPTVLHYKEILQPLLRLIHSYSLRSSFKLEQSLVHLLQLICAKVSNDLELQTLCTEIGVSVLRDPLPLLNPLVQFLHRDGILGLNAKNAALLLVALSHNDEEIAISVALQSDFCPVLATALSALYSALPRKLPAYCHSILLGQINDFVIQKYPPLQHFLHYLRFCCQVNEIAHPLVREAVLHYVYNGFLLPVIGSSFNQNSLDEVITATIYFDLFLRTITDSSLLKAFLCFIIAESYDGYRLIDSILNRLNSNTGLGVASLSLMNTLISFKCEDVMFELVFRHLIPCKHLSLKDDSPICDRESIKDSFEIFLELSTNSSQIKQKIEPELLDAASKSLECCSHACELTWQFDYDGVNPSPDYLDKVLDPTQLQKPFHGFLDHYSQLLEMRDNCKKHIGYSPAVSRRSNSTSAYFDLNGSCNFTPRSQISRSNSFDTITSLKFENDSQLDLCLKRLRYPSAEDLLEQQSRYVISYNIIDQVTDDESVVCSPFLSKKVQKDNDKKQYMRGFDLARAISGDSIESTPSNSGISMEDLENLANSEEINSFKANLDKIKIGQDELRSCAFSLDDVMNSILNTNKLEKNQKISPNGSVISMQSALTIEDNILSDINNVSQNKNHVTNPSTKKTAAVGLFLSTILERLEKFHLNPFQINLQLTAIVTTLLSFPQPLLRNYLLNPREQFPDGIKCLYKILNFVKSKMDESKIKKDEQYLKKMCLEARTRLDKRLDLLEKGDLESEEQTRICGQLQSTESDITIIKLNKTEKRHFNLLEFLSRKSNSSEVQLSNGWLMAKGRPSKDDIEYYTNLNLAFASILFEELCKEIASFSKEHYVFRR